MSSMEETELRVDSSDDRKSTNSEHFCELCSLDFTTQNELEEHTWSMLHNTNLNRKQGRDCVHSCSLCKQEFVGLLEFTGHLHGDSHQEKLHNWRRDQHREWSPDRRPLSGSPNQMQQSRTAADWSTDDFSGFVDYFSDHSGEVNMGDNWRGNRGPLRDPRDIPSFPGPPPQFGYHHQEQFDRRRDNRDQFQERGYPPWNGRGRGQSREFIDGTPPNPDPEYPELSQENDRYHWRNNSDDRQNDKYYGDSGYAYPNDGWRGSYDTNPQFRSRPNSQPHHHGDRRHNSYLPHNDSRPKFRSVVGSVVPSRKQNEIRPSSRNTCRKTEGTTDSRQKEAPPDKQTQGRSSPGGTKRKGSDDKTPPKSSPSGSPSGRNTRKGQPRKLARPVEENKGERDAGHGDTSPTKDKKSEKMTRKVQADNNKIDIKIRGKEKERAESSKESSTVSQSTVKVTKDTSSVESSDSTSKEKTVTKPLWLTKLMAKDDSTSLTTQNPSLSVKGYSSVTVKGDFTSSAKTNSITTAKGESLSALKPPLSVKGDSLPILERGQKSFMTDKDKEDHTKDTNQSTSHSKGNEEQNSTKKENSVPSLDKQNSSKTVNSLPVFSEKDMKSSKLGEDSSLFTREKSELAPNPKDKDESLKTTDKLITLSAPNDRQGSSCFNQNFSSSISENKKEKTLDINVSRENRQNAGNLAHSVTTISTMSSLPWEQREEKLRSLLGIKREPKDTESQEDSIPCPVSKDKKVTTESETHPPVCSSIVSTVTTALSVGSVKPVSSRYIPGFSQLSLSRPQCSFVHIDGVQCGSVTWNKYCSYHQRVFKDDEGSSLEQSVTSKASHIMRDETRDRESSPRSLNSRPGGTQIFRPTTPPYKPPERLGVVSGLEEEIGHRLSYSDKYEKEKGKKKLSDARNSSVKTSDKIDLNSTSTYTALRAATDASSGNIDLSTTLPGVSRGLYLRGSSTDINSDRSSGASTGTNTATSVGTSIGDSIDLSDTVPRPRRMLAIHDNSLDSDNGGPGIDLSGTVPNLEGLLALHGSSTVEAKGGSQIDLSKTVLKHGRSWKHQELSGESGSNIDLGSTISNRGSSVSSDSGPNIDLSETVPQPGRSRTPHEFTHFDLKEAHLPNVNPQATASSATSRLKSDVLHPQKHLVKTEPEEIARPSAIQNTEMIDLNFSTKLLGVPHSVVAPFNASNPSSKKPFREKTKSPSEFSTRSSVLSSPRSFAASPPQSPLSSRRVSTTTHLPVDRSPESTISLPSLSLDLSRFNLPPEVRKALAERYSGKKVTSTTSDHPVKPIEGRRSQPLFSEHKTEQSFEPGKKASPLPARLRGRGQRSISLDSPMVRRENLHAEGSSRLGLLERGNMFDVNQFLGRQTNKEEIQQTGLRVGDNIPASLTTGLTTAPPSTRISPLSVPPKDSVPTKDNSEELQSRGLIDLSSTSYLEGMSAPSASQGRMAEGLRLTIDNLRSPPRPSVLQSQGLIDLNSSTEYAARDTAMDSPEPLPVIKRKRLNTSEDSESVSSLGAEKNVKRSKQEDTDPRADKPVTYRSGINVQELLSIERDEQNQLQNLHAVQSRLKSVRSQIQKLCTELDSLSSEEQRITLRMGELRNLRLSILENACYERQMSPLPARIETSTRETRTSAAQVGRYDSKTLTTSSEPDKLGNVLEKTDGHVISSSRDNTSCSNDTKGLPSNNRESNMGTKQITSEAELSVESSVCSTAESLMNSSRSCDPPQSEEQFSSVGTATKFVSREETSQSSQPREKVLERLIQASKRAAMERKSSSEVELNRGAKISEQTSCDLPVDISSQQQGVVAIRLDADSGPSVLGVPVILEDPASLKSSESESSQSGAKQELHNKVASGQTNEQSRKDLMKKAKHFHSSEKALLRKKSFSDINVSKTIEASRKKIQSARENMKRWKQQEDGIDLHGSHEEKISKNSDNSPSCSNTGSAENVSEAPCKDNQGSLPLKIVVRDSPSPRKTTKELKKSSFFNSGKKNTKEWRKNKMDKREKRFKDLDAIPSKRRKIGDTSCTDTQRSAPFKEKTSSKGRNQVVSAAAHTTTADLEGSGTEERANTEDEIPTRDVDSQSDDKSSSVRSRASHLQMPSSTVEYLKKTFQYSKGKKHRGSSSASKFEGHTGAVCGLKVHNGHLFTCSADKTTRSFNIQTGECVKVYHGHHQAVNCIEMSEDKDRLFTGSNDQTVRSYNIKSGVCTHKFTFDGRVMCLHLAFGLLFVGLNTGIVASIDLMTNKLRERFHCHEPRGVSCLTSATEGERKLLCCGSFDSTITIRDYKTGLLIRTFSHHSMTVLCLQVVDHIMYSGSADMKVQAHNLNTGELLRSFHGHTMSVSGLQIVGRVLVTSCLDKLIRCYDLTTGDLLQVYGGQIDMIFSVLVSNGRIYSGGRDGFVGATKLDLRVYHPCKWENCELNFGVVSHLKNHIREYHVMEKGTVEACHWFQCGHQFSADDDIAAVLKHVLGHVVTRTARKSVS